MHRLRIIFRLFAALLPFTAGAADKLSFNRDIRPILSDKCFPCHGPDEKKRDSGLRLDIREEALKERDGIRAIVPGKPDESDVVARITSGDRDEMMPKPKAKLGALTLAEVEAIKRWIAEGAEYEPHWSFISLKPVDAPGIDPLIERRLVARGLKPQPEADRNTLIRRVSFDLIGLPPTPQEVETFVNDSAPDAYERVVDRLLASPHYGERMAVDWLDVSRYADSYGFQVDREREVWPWRDWVVRAFNDNLSFDQFVTWQLAGDLLPSPTDDQVLATAFNRLHQQESEGGSVEEEYRVEYVTDRVQTFATAFLGLTFECARCHDHKFDPITQKEFYQIFSFFQNIDEAGLYSYFTMSPPTPTHVLADAATKKKLLELQTAVTDEEKKLAALRESKQDAFVAWLPSRPTAVKIPGEIGGFGFESLDNGKLANWIDEKQPATLKGENKLVAGRVGNAVEFTGDDPVDLPFGNFQRYQPFSVSLWLKTPDVKERAVVFHRSRAWTDAASRGYELLIEEGKLKWSLIHFWPGNAISIRAKDAPPVNEWTHVVVTSDGSSRAAGLRLFVNGKLAPSDVIKDTLTKDITGGGSDNISLGERFRDRGFKGGAIDEFRVFGRELTPLEALATFDQAAANATLAKDFTELSKEERESMHDYFLATVDADWAKQLGPLKAARGGFAKAADEVREIMAMRELPTPKKAYVLSRGEYNQRRAEVQAGVPAALSPWPEGAPKNRLGLARWITDPRHPLTARVTVNRFWQSIFGRGLVRTAEDFGSQGTRPIYPEVLDWLALRFIQSGWDTKALMKTMVMSQTYRQRSIADAKTMADDPDNELLARGPRFRLGAEMIRDNALAAAGLLSTTLGGGPVNPYEMSESFKPETPSGGDGVYRRSLYTNWRRTGPPPAMIAFDAPRRAVCIAKRERTDSPLQALILLNGTQYVEAARVLGEKLHRETNGDLPAMIEQGFLRCLSRKPDARERDITSQLYREQRAHFQAKPEEAA
ncbi:MAG TPA: DUF1553 domain-containing protein, partial [Chthoniobacteraceae bacterium]|nr:DUF1553 domain-containing protein [Chthoniobacteraceae bacterium]